MSGIIEIEFEITSSGSFPLQIFSTCATQCPDNVSIVGEEFRKHLIKKITEYANTPGEDNKKCIIDRIDNLATYTNCYVVKRTIENMDYYHGILYKIKNVPDVPQGIFISIIVGCARGNTNSSDCHVVKGSLNFFSNDVGTFTPSTCENTCHAEFNVAEDDTDTGPPIVDKEKKYITWTPSEGYFDGDCTPHKQYYMIEDKELHPDYPSGQHTHEEHLEHIKEDNNLPLILGLSLGIGIPILAVIVTLIIKKSR